MTRLPVLAVMLVGAFAAGSARAELLSTRPITIVVPFTPGASADNLQRLVVRKVTEDTGQSFVVESRPGGGGAIASVAVKQAPPDGHMLLQANAGSHAANAALYPSLSYDPVRDFKPITLMWSFAQLLAVPTDSPAKSVAELVALAGTKPGGLSFGSQGSGAGGHLLGEMLRHRTGARMVHVPYRGAGPAAVDLAAGRIDFFFVAYASILPVLQSGKVRVLAVSSPNRLGVMPDTPTMRESGFSGIELDAWFGLMAPAGTPDPIIGKLNAAFAAALKEPGVSRQISEQGAQAVPGTPAELGRFIVSETERMGAIIRSLGIKGE